MNSYKPLGKETEIAVFYKSRGILSGSFLLNCKMLCSSREGNVSQAHENRLGLFTEHVHGTHNPPSATLSLSHPTVASTQLRGKKKKQKREENSLQALNPALLILHRHISDSLHLCTVPLSSTTGFQSMLFPEASQHHFHCLFHAQLSLLPINPPSSFMPEKFLTPPRKLMIF